MDRGKAEIDAVIGQLEDLDRSIAQADYEVCRYPSITCCCKLSGQLLLTIPCVVKEQVRRMSSILATRDELVTKIPKFWPRIVPIRRPE